MIFRFDEPVEGNFGAVRVYDASGERVDEGDAFHPGGEGPRLGVHLKPGLPDGSYTATYRVVSADGHIVSSGFVFSIGKQGKAPQETVAQLIGGAGSGPVTETAFGIARGLQYAAIALGFGGLFFLLLVWLPALGAVGGGGAEWAAGGACLPAPAAHAALGGGGDRRDLGRREHRPRGRRGGRRLRLLGARRDDRPRDPRHPLRHHLGLRPAVAWVVFAAALPLLLAQERAPRLRLLLAVPLAFVVHRAGPLRPRLDPVAGRSSTSPSTSIHVGAMAIWLGGLAALLCVASRRDPAARRGRSQPPARGRPRRASRGSP